jgi:HSP20 family protein
MGCRCLGPCVHGASSYLFPSPCFSPSSHSVEICDQPQSHYITATFELPGLKKEDIGVHLTPDGHLTISGDRRAPPLLTNADPALTMYPVKELKYGTFERTINVPAGLEVCDSIWFSIVRSTLAIVVLTRLGPRLKTSTRR